jgi:response regulator RpfG family c-di-GMP phosphodiesterase
MAVTGAPTSMNAKSQAEMSEQERLSHLLAISEGLNDVRDLDSVLENILMQARSIASADAGTIYLREGAELAFSYTQNASLYDADQVTQSVKSYNAFKLPITQDSVAGYVADTGQAVNIADVYAMPRGTPYGFAREYDEKIGYRTRSMLTVPLQTTRNELVGVMQVLNAAGASGQAVFSERDQLYISLLANTAAVAIDKAKMTRSIVLRMIRVAELRDPKETGAHVNRVAAYSSEIYRRWAGRNEIPEDEFRRNRDQLRIAAMLHDVGKVAIPDSILKKPGKLTAEEFSTMQQHSVIGARLFSESGSDWDALSAEIALRHHERWDGRGYPGTVDIGTEPIVTGKGLAGTEIPLFGRIVGLADVYDALMSRRTYKEAWEEDDVLQLIKDESGKHFDPGVVRAFHEVYPVIKAIRNKFSD